MWCTEFQINIESIHKGFRIIHEQSNFQSTFIHRENNIYCLIVYRFITAKNIFEWVPRLRGNCVVQTRKKGDSQIWEIQN